MKMFLRVSFGLGLLLSAGAQAGYVTIGDPGNAGDARYYGDGGVAYTYQMSEFELTAGEYAAFLNAVAASDPYGLYNPDWMNWSFGDSTGCQITRIGSDGSYAYDFSGRPSGTEADWSNRPVNYVSWYDAARYTNWLTTNDTETGVYAIDSTDPDPANWSVTVMDHQLAAATYGTAYFIPTVDEWYKAAYYDGATDTYYDYPTGSNTAPTSEAPAGGTNSANFYGSTYAIGSPYYRTNVGAYSSSPSPYGTFDQGGNVYEWTETLVGSSRNTRRASFYSGSSFMRAAAQGGTPVPTTESSTLGFRVASMIYVPAPEPTSALLLALSGLVATRRRRS